MRLKQRVYSVLVVSAAERFNASLRELLPEQRYTPIVLAPGINAAKRLLTERSFDFVIVNAPLPDDSGLTFSIDVTKGGGSIVLLLIRSELHDEVFDRVAEHGVFTLSKPTSRQAFQTVLEWMASARERLRMTELQTLSLEEKMNEIRIVNRAKCLLISELKMDEPTAHRFLEKQAMDRCISRRALAEEIISMYGSV